MNFERYAALFAAPDIASTLRASIIGRLPIGIAMLAILLHVQSATGSFAVAGAASSLYVFGLAALAPFIGRLIDRLGPRPVLVITGIAYPAALGALLLLVAAGAHALWIGCCAFVAGAMLPPVTICVRTLFPRLVDDPALLQTAYSVDSALVEFVFIVGPALVALFVALSMPAGAVMLAALCGAAGSVMFVRAPAIKDWVLPAETTRPRLLEPLGNPHLRAILAATVLYSVAFGLLEVGITVYAAERDMPAAAGVVLALASIGSAVGAVIYGSRDWPHALPRQLVLALLLMAAGMGLLAAVPDIYAFGALSVAACLPMAPVIAVQALLISRLAPRAMLAQSFTWGTTCLLGGISGGIALGGIMAETWASPVLLLTGAVAAVAAALIVRWAFRRTPIV